MTPALRGVGGQAASDPSPGIKVGSGTRGSAYILLNCVCIAVGSILLHASLTGRDPIEFSFYCFACVVVATALIRLCSRRPLMDTVASCSRNLRHVLALNATTAAGWILYFVSIKFLDGALVNALLFGTAPIAALVLSRQQSRRRVWYSLAILALLGVLASRYVVAGHGVMSSTTYFSIAAGVLAGTAVGGATVSMKALSLGRMNPIDVVLLRYLGTLVATFVIVVVTHRSIVVSGGEQLSALGLGLLIILVPTLLVQLGIREVSPFNATALASSIPAMTYFVAPFFGASLTWLESIVYALLWPLLIRLSAAERAGRTGESGSPRAGPDRSISTSTGLERNDPTWSRAAVR